MFYFIFSPVLFPRHNYTSLPPPFRLPHDIVCHIKKKVKVTLVQALRLCTGRTAYRGSRGIALHFHDHGTRRGMRGQRHAPAAFYPGKEPKAGWVPGQVWTGAENLAPPTGSRSLDRPARSQSLYRLSYPARPVILSGCKFVSGFFFCAG